MGVIIDEIDFDEYNKIKKKTDKDPNLEKRIRKITPEEVLKEIEAGASYNLRESLQSLRERVKRYKRTRE